ncbi:MAG: adenylate kinase [Vicinamibacterales bacterium]
MGQFNIVLIGPPGSGKGTQAARICERHQVPMISTGDILRAAVKAGSPLGKQVQAIIATGGLVSDQMMVDLVAHRLAQDDARDGFVLDGFPRTVVQAEELDRMLDGRPFLAIVLVVPEAELERRLGARRICSQCRTLYTTGTLYGGSEEELCSSCGATLIRRDDDNIQTIRHRLLTYRQTAEPLIEHYQHRSALAVIDGMRSPEDVARGILDEITTNLTGVSRSLQG